MSEMFKNYPQPEDYIPNNRPKCQKPFRLDIMTGETAIHTFEVPFNVEEECDNFEVIYQLGIKPIIIKSSYSLTVFIDENGNSIITCKLNPNETKLFETTCLDTKVQIKFVMNDGSVIFSDIYKVIVNDSLDMNREKPDPDKPGMIYGIGYGYTED